MSADRVTVDDLAFAVEWMGAYEGEGDDGLTAADCPDSTDPNVQRCRRLAAWLTAEVDRREHAAHERALAAAVADQLGRPRTDPRVLAAVRTTLAEHYTTPTGQSCACRACGPRPGGRTHRHRAPTPTGSTTGPAL